MKIITLERLRKSGRKSLFIIPHFFTFANAFFGFLAVTKTFDGQFVAAAYCIMAAAVMDMFDGRIARALHSSSYLGTELDSLSDAVSFCFAPAVLLYSWYLYDMGLLGIFALTAYLCAGLLRLARFNIAATDKEPKPFFVGLPTTMAAFIITQLVTNARWIAGSHLRFLLHPVGILLFVTALAFLMISPVRFPSFKRLRFSRRGALLGIIIASSAVVVAATFQFPLVLLVLLGFVVSSVALEFYSFARTVL